MAGYNVLLRNARLDATRDFAGNAALMRVYDGVRPATGGAATTLLAELVCGSPLAPNAAIGVQTFNAVTQDSSANATGTASWVRIVKADGTTHVMDLSVGTSGAEVILNALSIVLGGIVTCTSAVITAGNA